MERKTKNRIAIGAAILFFVAIIAEKILLKNGQTDLAIIAGFAVKVLGVVTFLGLCVAQGAYANSLRTTDFRCRWKRELKTSVLMFAVIFLVNKYFPSEKPFSLGWAVLISSYGWIIMFGSYAFWRPNKQDLFRDIYLQWVLSKEGSEREQKFEGRLLSNELYPDGVLTTEKWACAYGHVLDHARKLPGYGIEVLEKERQKFARLPIPEEVKEKVRASHPEFRRWHKYSPKES